MRGVLIGREHEQGIIDRLVAGARIGTSGVLVLTGEAGVGKSALLQWAEGRLERFRVLRAVGTETEREVSFGGLLAVLRPALPLMRRIDGPQASALASALAMAPGPVADRFAVGAATLSLLSRYAEEAPLAVLLDDAHLLDRPSLEALLFAARRLGADPVLMLLAARTDEWTALLEGVPALPVAGLDRRSTGRLADTVVTNPVTTPWLDTLHAVTGGNPLGVIELAGDPEGLLPTGIDVPPPLPAALAASFTRRVGRLPARTRSALRVAGACGGDLRLTAQVCARLGLDVTAVEEAVEPGFVDLAEGSITFRHPLLRAAIYRAGPPHELRTIHRFIAQVLPAEESDRRAWHLSESALAPDEEVAAQLEEAAAHATGRSAHAVASTARERAARLSPRTADVSRRLVAASASAWAAGLGDRAITLLDELPPLSRGCALDTRALELRATIAARSGSLRVALDTQLRAAAETRSPDARVAVLADAVLSACHLADGTAARRLVELLHGAVEEATSPRARAVGTVAAGMAKVVTGAAGITELRAAVPLLADSAELRSDADGVRWLMYVPLFARDAETGRGLRSWVRQARNRAGVGSLPGLLFLLARDQATSDEWALAAASYTESIRLARDTGQTTELAMALAGLAWLESRTGEGAQCRAHAEEALALCRDRAIHWGEAWALFALGDLQLVQGDAGGAATHYRSLDHLLTTRSVDDPDLSPHPELVETLLRTGESAEAARVGAEYDRAAEAKGQPWARARAMRVRGLLEVDGFDEHFRAASRLHELTPDRFETARTSLAHGERLRRVGRRVEARVRLRAAREGFLVVGATPWADLAATELELTGERVPRRDPGGVGALTPQELQVAVLLAEGRSTRQAAAALFLSPKTVEYHLRKVYTKLDLHSRAELAEVVRADRRS